MDLLLLLGLVGSLPAPPIGSSLPLPASAGPREHAGPRVLPLTAAHRPAGIVIEALAASSSKAALDYIERAFATPAAASSRDAAAPWYEARPPQAEPPPREEPPPAALSAALDGLQRQSGSDAAFARCVSLLLRYCDNALADPDNAKFRTIRSSAKAFQRGLASLPAAADALAALGFERAAAQPVCEGGVCSIGGGGAEEFVLPATADAATELRRGSAHLRHALTAAQYREAGWPTRFSGALPAACRALPAPLLETVAAELRAPHVPELLAHGDNAARVESALGGGPAAVEALTAQLAELRKEAEAAAGGGAGEGRVVAVESAEAWYDLLMAPGGGLLVADFGAPWCGPCAAVKPLFAALSLKPEFAGVTFARLDAEMTPQLMGDHQVDSFPTFKFFRDAEEEDLPVVGGDIDGVEQRIRSLLAEARDTA